MKLNKLKLYGNIGKFFPYLMILYFTVSYLFFFESIINLFLLISFLAVFIFSIIQYVKLYKKNTKEIKTELENEIKNMKINSTLFTPEFLISYARKIPFTSKRSMDRIKILIAHLFKQKELEREKLVSAFQGKFFEKIKESLQILLYFINIEEYELNKYLSIKRKKHFLFWSISQVIVLSLILIFGFLIAFIELPQFFIFFLFLIILLLFVIFRDIKLVVNKKFQNGLNRYHKNKKIFSEYQISLNLLCNNHYFLSLEQYKDVKSLLNLTNLKINYYKEIIKPYYFYMLKYEIIGFFGILCVIISAIFQEISHQISITLFNFNIITIILFLVFICGFIIIPIILFRKPLKINILIDERGKKLKENLELLKVCQYAFIIINKNQN